jgi:methylmalonyl-CoA/ethylmalonyl-CoA epimerase
MPKIKRIDHIAIVVEDIEAALQFWRDALGLEVDQVQDISDQKSTVAFLPVGEGDVELVKPTTDDSGIARYLEKRGPGMHHICFEVEDIEATLEQLKGKGVRLINDTPLAGSAGKKLAFIHPESTNGVLVELYQLAPLEPETRLAQLQSLAERVYIESAVLTAATRAFLRALRTNSSKKQPEREAVSPEELAN